MLSLLMARSHGIFQDPQAFDQFLAEAVATSYIQLHPLSSHKGLTIWVYDGLEITITAPIEISGYT